MTPFRCCHCNSLSNNEGYYPCCSRQCENETIDRRYNSEREILNLRDEEQRLDYEENNPTCGGEAVSEVDSDGACPHCGSIDYPCCDDADNADAECVGYGNMCMCGICLRTWMNAVSFKYSV